MKIKSVLSLCLLTPLLCSCASVLNTWSGLTTFQSTISGSNYPFYVKEDGKLSLINEFNAKNLIGKNQNFEITLDAGFLRYLQAPDPYVLVYSKAWIGDNPPPTDDKSYLRQILLIKEGTAFNARLPLSSLPLLGPLTMGDKLADVHLSLHVVVLSKQSNEETTNLLDNLAATVATVQPQYAVIAGAAAAIGDAIISQNKDKIEFEHKYKFSAFDSASENAKQAAITWTPTLATGRYVVIKGEDENRLVPYDNWFFYVSPFNWLGHKPSIDSTRFELKKGMWDIPYEDSNLTLINSPFKFIHQLLLPNESLLGRYNRLGGDFLSCHAKSESPPSQLLACGSYLLKKGNCDATIDDKLLESIYTDKTYVIVSIKRTDTTYGSYDNLLSKFKQQADFIDELKYSTSKVDYVKSISKLQNILAYEAAKKTLASTNEDTPFSIKTIKSFQDNKNLSPEEQATLLNSYLEQQDEQSIKRLSAKIESWMETNKSVAYSTVKTAFDKFAKKALTLEKAPWDKACATFKTSDLIKANWSDVLETVKIHIIASENVHATDVSNDFGALIPTSAATLNGGCK